MDLVIPVDQFKKVDAKDTGGTTEVHLTKVDMEKFMEQVFMDEKVNEFLSHPDILDMFAKRIGVPGLLKSFDRTEVCDEITWDYIKEYFLDHMDFADCLDHIGWEAAKKHFADHLEAETGSVDVGSDEPALLDKLDK
jgi:hypothetical protein